MKAYDNRCPASGQRVQVQAKSPGNTNEMRCPSCGRILVVGRKGGWQKLRHHKRVSKS